MRNVERWVTETLPVERGSNQLIRKISLYVVKA